MVPIIDHQRVSKGLREVIKPATPGAPETGTEGLILIEDHAPIRAIVDYIRDRAQEVAALIGQDVVRDLDRTMKILHEAESRKRENESEKISGIRELALLQIKRICELIVFAEHRQIAEAKSKSMERRVAYLEENNRVLEKEAHVDEATNLFNKRGLKVEGKKIFEHCEEEGIPISCLYIDIDYFKIPNDKYGQEVGDAILKAFAGIIAEELRGYDLVFQAKAKKHSKKPDLRGENVSSLEVITTSVIGKDGGDEVVVLMPHTDLEEAAAAGERLRKRIQDMKFSVTKRNGHSETFIVDLTCTIGVAEADFETHQTVNNLKAFANDALKTGKKHHRNIVCTTPQKKAGLSFDFILSDPSRKVIEKLGRYDHTDGENRSGEGSDEQF